MMDLNTLFKVAFGHIVTKSREMADMNMEDLSKNSTIPLDRLQDIEDGTTEATVVEIIRLALALEMRPASLILRAEVYTDIITGKDAIVALEDRHGEE